MSGFPSVRSNMLKEKDVRGEALLDTSKFSYSHYLAHEKPKVEAEHGLPLSSMSNYDQQAVSENSRQNLCHKRANSINGTDAT